MGCTWAQFWTLRLTFFSLCVFWTKSISKYNFFLKVFLYCVLRVLLQPQNCVRNQSMCLVPCQTVPIAGSFRRITMIQGWAGTQVLVLWDADCSLVPLYSQTESPICYVTRCCQNHVLFLPNLQQLMWKSGSDVQVYKFPGFTSFLSWP